MITNNFIILKADIYHNELFIHRNKLFSRYNQIKIEFLKMMCVGVPLFGSTLKDRDSINSDSV